MSNVVIAVLIAVAAAAVGGTWGFAARYLRVSGGPWAGRVTDASAIVVIGLMMTLLDQYQAPAVIASLAGFSVGRFVWPALPPARSVAR